MQSPSPPSNVELALRYIAAIEAGATGETLAAFFTPDVVITEMPNRLNPAGALSELPAILAAAERGQMLMKDQRYEVRSAIGHEEHGAVELEWSGTIAVPGGPMARGTRMRGHVAVFLEFRDGKIAAQRHYDCYDPF